ncbi:TetR/AcrR family transcriptional regulator [Bradyrhizobium manausense]|uniref:TetR/AcrR family transcriptional regulator n=1 Tax=Bradyrhizobium manausense TaxID=989370 RepID=UPI001BA73CCF|nr:TetR/AcrR family transcriptional regulator [Bradyrhizobium manausense]MBR1087663.1 TetR/AcrR family transcriptional regulator [Bradyrhizobium manausense]
MKPERQKRKLTLVKKLGKAQKLTRAQKQSQIRAALLEAAAKVVGEVGYSAAMVSTITRRAGVAQGTFYNYFRSRQDLFDQLLPSMSEEMLGFIKERSSLAPNDAAREKLRFEAYFAYLVKRPEFYRILYESELFSPEAFQQHIDVVANGYQRVLKRAADAGDAHTVDPREYEVLAFMLMGARKYLSSRFARSNGSMRELPDFVTKAYMRFVCNGFWDEHASIANSSPARQTRKPALVSDRVLRGEKA